MAAAAAAEAAQGDDEFATQLVAQETDVAMQWSGQSDAVHVAALVAPMREVVLAFLSELCSSLWLLLRWLLGHSATDEFHRLL